MNMGSSSSKDADKGRMSLTFWCEFQKKIDREKKWKPQSGLKPDVRKRLKNLGKPQVPYEVYDATSQKQTLETMKENLNRWMSKGSFVLKPSDGADSRGVMMITKIGDNEWTFNSAANTKGVKVLKCTEHVRDCLAAHIHRAATEFYKGQFEYGFLMEKLVAPSVWKNNVAMPSELKIVMLYGRPVIAYWAFTTDQPSNAPWPWRADTDKFLPSDQLQDEEIMRRILRDSADIMQEFGYFYGRVDWFLENQNGHLKIYVNEVQNHGLYPKQAVLPPKKDWECATGGKMPFDEYMGLYMKQDKSKVWEHMISDVTDGQCGMPQHCAAKETDMLQKGASNATEGMSLILTMALMLMVMLY